MTLKITRDLTARTTSHGQSLAAARASHEWVTTNDWQIEEIRKGLEEADSADFASEEDVDLVVGKWRSVAH